MPWPLPSNVVATCESAAPVNFGLLFHRYIQYGAGWELGDEAKSEAWDDFRSQATNLFTDGGFQRALAGLELRLDRAETSLRAQGWVTLPQPLKASVCWRLAIGLSAPSVLGMGMTLHRIYGFPYLPASGLKGVTRNYRFQEIAAELNVPPLDKERRKTRRESPQMILEGILTGEEPETAQERKQWEAVCEKLQCDEDAPGALCGKSYDQLRNEYAMDFLRAFGSQDRQGEVIFLDALPVSGQQKALCDVDLINPHYQPHYSDPTGVSPADVHSPIPVKFPVVPQGVEFRLRIAASDQALLDRVSTWMKEAIRWQGAGAKTWTGYGEMAPRIPKNSEGAKPKKTK